MNIKIVISILAFAAAVTSVRGNADNRLFGNCTDSGTDFSYAPAWINGRHMSRMTADDYARHGWWPVTDVAPSCTADEYAKPTGWVKHSLDNTREEIDLVPAVPPQTNEYGEVVYVPVTNTVHFTTWWIERTYTVVTRPPEAVEPRRIDKYDLSAACIEYGVLSNLIALVSADVETKWMWDAAEVLLDNDPYFVAATNAAISGGVDAKLVRDIIDRAYSLSEATAAAGQ